MIIYRNSSTDPYFNLAAEQYLMDTENDEIFMLWRNSPAVIIGRNQNAYAEINDSFVRTHNIKVVRRMTGGGAVFHDLGNVNFTCIVPQERCTTLDFLRFTTPVIKALRDIGVPAEATGRNDISAEGKKISGNAQCVYNGKVMHHGTLLFGADLSYMTGALNVDPDKIASKGIKSIRARVGNIGSYVPDMNVEGFIDYLENCFPGEKRELSDTQKSGIQRLADEKYSTWEWNYGASRQFTVSRKHYFDFGLVCVRVTADGGIIRDIRFEGDYFGINPIEELEKRLIGVKYENEALKNALEGVSDYIMGAAPSEISELIIG